MILIIHKKNVEAELIKVREILNFFSQDRIVFAEDLDQVDKSIFFQSELIIILGGDGTTLRTLSKGDYKEKYVLSINAGKVGFIGSVVMDSVKKILQSFFLQKYSEIKMDKRHWLMTTMGGEIYKALNEISIYRGASSRMLFIKAFFNGVPTVQFRADGLIVATSTGSTAYNLSAGGPIVHPDIQAIIFNPICPYSLTLKPIVVPQSDRITVEAELHGETLKQENFCVSFDGQKQVQCSQKTRLDFYLSDSSVCFIRSKGENYYTTLQKKINWGRGVL